MPEEPLYTLFVAKSNAMDDDVVIASGVTLAQTAKAIRERDGLIAFISDRDYRDFRSFELRKLDGRMRPKVVIGATVPKTLDPASDRQAAEKLINVQVVERAHDFCALTAVTDQEFDQRTKLKADRRATKALEEAIVTQLVDTLLVEGYRITACASWDSPRFRNSKRRDAILKHLFALEIADLLVTLDKTESWISLIFGESGWDTIADYGIDLAHLIEPIVEPHLPWNKPGGSHERGYNVVQLPSPEQLAIGDPETQDVVERFFATMEQTFG